MKQCSCCREHKTLDQFYSDKRTPDGRKSQCKSCHTSTNIRTRNLDKKRSANAAYMARARAADPEKFQSREREASCLRPVDAKVHARAELNNAVKRGSVTKPSTCSSCGQAVRVTGHHEDYAKPLDVRWLCYSCHGKEHRHTEFKSVDAKDRS